MSQTLASDSPRRVLAGEFAARLRASMRKKGIGLKPLARLSGVNHTSLWRYQRAEQIPGLEAAEKLAESLDDDRLIEIVVRGRTAICPVDRSAFTYTAGPRIYCSAACSRVAAAAREGEDLELTRTVATRRVATLTGAIEAMCYECSPSGACRESQCPLRAVSPLPLVVPR